MAVHETPFGVSQMHSVSFAVSPVAAFGARACLHPRVVSVGPEAVLPHVPEVVAVYVALRVVCTYARAGADAAVDQHRRHGYPGLASEEAVAHAPFVACHEAFAAERGVDASLLACGHDELHQLGDLGFVEVELRVLLRAPRREDGEEPPSFHARLDELRPHLRQFVERTGVDACNHVEIDSVGLCCHFYRLVCTVERLRVAAHPVV